MHFEVGAVVNNRLTYPMSQDSFYSIVQLVVGKKMSDAMILSVCDTGPPSD